MSRRPLVSAAETTFRAQKRLAERAIEQLDDEALRKPLHPDTNSVAVIIKHMAGNMLSRWTDIFTSDGEKPNRNRDAEFVDDFRARDEIMQVWERGWASLFDTLGGLSEADLERTITIRGEPHTVIRAILRQIDHYGYHVGQIVQTARILAGDQWQVLSIPRGGSDEYNKRVWGG
jgi:uncharacterized damage-inducible protein DinB